jgi:hypothetical protein
MMTEPSGYFGKLATAAQRLVDAEMETGAAIRPAEVAAKVVATMPPPPEVTEPQALRHAMDEALFYLKAACGEFSSPAEKLKQAEALERILAWSRRLGGKEDQPIGRVAVALGGLSGGSTAAWLDRSAALLRDEIADARRGAEEAGADGDGSDLPHLVIITATHAERLADGLAQLAAWLRDLDAEK